MFPCVYLVQRTLLYLVSSGAVVIDKTFPGYQHRILDNTFHINLHLSIFQGHNILGFFRIGRDIEIRSQNADVIVTGMYIKRFTILCFTSNIASPSSCTPRAFRHSPNE